MTLTVPILYVASFGPACWLARQNSALTFHIADAYAPLLVLAEDGTALHWLGSGRTNSDKFRFMMMRSSLEARQNGGHGYPAWLPFAAVLERLQW
ncbi:MAG: hypothetical protein ACT4QC_00605 [Planctomycetaceae bacterium]